MKGRKIENIYNWTKYLWSWEQLKNPTYRMIELDLVNYCNRNCHWCCSRREHVKKKQSMTWETFTREITLASKLGAGIIFTGGGEPTLHPEFMRFTDICAQLVKDKMIPSFSLVTNGTNIENMEHFIKNTSEPHSWIRVSINYFDMPNELIDLFKRYPNRIGSSYIYGNDEERDKCLHNAAILKPYAKFCRLRQAVDYSKPHPHTNKDNCIGKKFHRVVESDGQLAYCCQSRGMNGECIKICPESCRWGNINLDYAWEWNPFS